ncbi:MAG: transcriptional repressor [Deltaproteobacteria bacterium]|jgi:Fur family ferric uptake transcriptional regulator|nr:MAG: transcriptional repressor [Deltaproteobacteria bacterium]
MKEKQFKHKQAWVKTFFHARGFKCTPQRLAVLSVLKNSPKHLSISEIHSRVREFLPKVGLATIYRTLETLEELGLVVKVHLEDGCHSYTVVSREHGHPMVCVGCNRVFEFRECPIDKMSKRLSRKTGFVIETHFLQFLGKCQDCKR